MNYPQNRELGTGFLGMESKDNAEINIFVKICQSMNRFVMAHTLNGSSR